MPVTVFGIPLHPLMVHATVVTVPLACVLAILDAAWPRYRVWAGPLTWVVGAAALALSVLAAKSGEALRAALPTDPRGLIQQHAAQGDFLKYPVFVLFVATFAAWWLRRRTGTGALVVVASVIAVVAALGTVADVVLIGHTGAEAVWCGLAKGSPPCPTRPAS